MFSFAPGLDHYVENRRKKVVDENYSEIKRIKTLNQSLTKEPLTKEITDKLVDAIERCINAIEKAETTLEFVSNFRFLFETCIHTHLLYSEPSFKYKYRFSIYKHQIEKSKDLEKNARNSIDRLRVLKAAESNLRGNFQACDALYDDLDREINILQEMAEFNGADYHISVIENYISQSKEREKNLEKDWEAVKKQIISDPIACELFEFKNQTSRVEKALKDNRSWKQKAKDVGLGDMYDFIYSYSSSLLHSTSYSTLTPSALELPERLMIQSLSTKVAYVALNNLKLFSKIPNFQVIHIDG
ncbi:MULTISPECIES: hypothetical protein, partial [Vibrio harveyi group]|uniref:hypothetical protein n=1 Tax=Vibrio harveyi group TaxID=717610 RepID=UPI0005EF07E8